MSATYLITTGLRAPAMTFYRIVVDRVSALRRGPGNLIDTTAESTRFDRAGATCFIALEGGRE
jgi:hypothetical protein